MEKSGKFSIEQDSKLLFIGETGSGKSTLINMAINIFHGLSFDDQRKIAIPQKQKFEIEVDGVEKSQVVKVKCNIPEFVGISSENEDECGAGENQSQTMRPSIYVLKDKITGKQLTIIDTPGLNDTRGPQFDEKHIQAIIHAIFCINGINAVCFVVNATQARLTSATELALRRLTNMFTKECMDNIVVCLSNSPSNISPNCKKALAELGFSQKNIIRFENNCLVHPDYYRKLSKDHFGTVAKDVEKRINSNSDYWEQNDDSFRKLLSLTKTFTPLNTEAMRSLYLEKESSDKIIDVIVDQIRELEAQKQYLLVESSQIKSILSEIDNTKDFTIKNFVLKEIKKKVTEVRKEKKYHNYRNAKWQRRDDNPEFSYGWYYCKGFFTLGILFATDAIHSEIGVYNDRVIEDYYEWVDVPYEMEVTQLVKVEESLIDSQKQDKFLNAQASLKVAQQRIESLEKEAIRTESEIKSSYQIVAHLMNKIRSIQAGDVISPEVLISQIDTEIERIKIIQGFSKGKIEFLLNKKERLERARKIMEKAAALPASELTIEQKFKIEISMMEEEKNESSKLKALRTAYEKVKPCLINNRSD